MRKRIDMGVDKAMKKHCTIVSRPRSLGHPNEVRRGPWVCWTGTCLKRTCQRHRSAFAYEGRCLPSDLWGDVVERTEFVVGAPAAAIVETIAIRGILLFRGWRTIFQTHLITPASPLGM